MSRYDHPCYRHLDSIKLHQCAECGDPVRDSDTCWHMATPVCPVCWLKIEEGEPDFCARCMKLDDDCRCYAPEEQQ